MNADATDTDRDAEDTNATETEDVLADLLDGMEGLKREPAPGEQSLRCDYCSGLIPVGSTPTHYASTLDLAPGSPAGDQLMLQCLYCEECHRNSVRFPCAGVLELICEHRLTSDYRLVDWSIADHSVRADGIPWDPAEVIEVHIDERYLDAALASAAAEAHGEDRVALGPADALDQLSVFGIDPREAINDDGTTNTDPGVVADSRQKVAEALDEHDMKRSTHTERTRGGR